MSDFKEHVSLMKEGFYIFSFVCYRNGTKTIIAGHMMYPVWPKTYQNVVHEALLRILKITNKVMV
jgi:hypothetical protein